MNVRLAKLHKMDEQLERNDIQGARATLHSVMPRQISDKKKATRARKRADTSAKAEKHQMSTKEIRAFCVKRAMGCCECGCGRTGWGLTMDHWLSGSGQRRQKQSIETCWMLTLGCHDARQENMPSASRWNVLFERHCEMYGYPFRPHIVHVPVSRRSP